MPEPPDVAKTATLLPDKSQPSRNVLMIVGATYHQIGKPISTVSYPETSGRAPSMGGRNFGLSLISIELRLFGLFQSRSADVYDVLGLIS